MLAPLARRVLPVRSWQFSSAVAAARAVLCSACRCRGPWACCLFPVFLLLLTLALLSLRLLLLLLLLARGHHPPLPLRACVRVRVCWTWLLGGWGCSAAAEERLVDAIASIESSERDIERLGREAADTRTQLARLESQAGACAWCGSRGLLENRVWGGFTVRTCVLCVCGVGRLPCGCVMGWGWRDVCLGGGVMRSGMVVLVSERVRLLVCVCVWGGG